MKLGEILTETISVGQIKIEEIGDNSFKVKADGTSGPIIQVIKSIAFLEFYSRWMDDVETDEEEKPDEKTEDKPSKQATPEDPDAPDKEDIAQAKDILSSKFASVNVTKGKITFKFETKNDLAELVERLTGTEMVV